MNARRELRWQWIAMWRYALIIALAAAPLSFVLDPSAVIMACLLCGVWRGAYLAFRHWKRK